MTYWFEEFNYTIEQGTLTNTNPLVAIPYLVGIIIAVVAGTAGNVLIIGAIYVSEVRT